MIILHNPASGRRKGRQKFQRSLEALRRLGADPEVRESRDARHLMALARQAAAESADLVVSAGGDGTHHYVLNGIFGSGVPLGIISLGSGNDLANGLGIPLQPEQAASVLVHGSRRDIDVARVSSLDEAGKTADGRVFACMAGTGFDAIVTRFANDHVRHVHGPMAYVWAILRCLKFYQPFTVEISSETRNFAGKIIFATVGNNTMYGGGLRMTPRARLDDGLLDVCIVTEMSKLELLRWVPRAYRGTHLKNPRILYFQSRSVMLRSESRLELFGDGEFVEQLPVRIEAVPRGLTVMVAKSELIER